MFKALTNRPFWVNLLAAAVLTFLLVFMLLQLLGWITKHGEYLTVPPVTGKTTQDAVKLLEGKGFDVMIQDSVYVDTAARGVVLKQLPDANATVKINRTVYLTVNRYTLPMIVMPSLEGKSLSYALGLMERSHLQLGDTIYRPHFMKGAVIEQQFQGSRIVPGTKLQWGSRITLVLGGGLDEQNILVPDLVGMTFGEARAQLDSLGILVNPVPNEEVKDTLAAFIYKQNPPHFDENNQLMYIRSGMVMDLWLSPVMIHLTDSAKKE